MSDKRAVTYELRLAETQRREDERDRKRRERRCFWTLPLGHYTTGVRGPDLRYRCVYCGKDIPDAQEGL
jgi:hypothetical protein